MARNPEMPPDDRQRGPAHRHLIGDHLYYIHPLTEERFVSVTTVLEGRSHEDLDHRWRPGVAAKAAFAHLPKVQRASITPDCGRTYGKCSRNDTRAHDWRERCDQCPCDVCERCVVKYLTYEHYRESTRATDRGIAFHDWSELWVLADGDIELTWTRWRQIHEREHRTAEALNAWADTIRPYTDSFRRWVDDYGLTPQSWVLTEATVLNRTHKWGGTTDGRIRLDANATKHALWMCERIGMADPVITYDGKSREKEEGSLFGDNALQVAAYRRAEVVLYDDGSEDMLAPDNAGAVLQVRPNGYLFRLVVADENTYRGFLGYLQGFMWAVEFEHESTLERAHPRRPLPGVSPEPKKRAPAKTTGRRKKTVDELDPVSAPTRTGRPAPEHYLTEATGKSVVDVPLPLDDMMPATPAPAAPVGIGAVRSAQARQSATLASIQRAIDTKTAHPDSPHGDAIPF